MTRTKKDPYAVKHEKHIARNGLTDIRSPLKKGGSGGGNWGSLNDQLADVKDDYREQAVAEAKKDTKLQLVDSEVFEHLHRRGEQRVIERQMNNLENDH
ncbi:hypothetical protein BDC45DRAFT_517189 [Circinella umbellata]|nr:hypothetical protein BDC45DRAFT_517189 [Circinella umbellata]